MNPARRTVCPACLRPQPACLCGCVQAVATRVEVLFLQHPLEVGHAKNTARLLHQCLPGSRLEVGEQWAPEILQDWLHQPWNRAVPPAPAPRTVLLYPPTPPDPQLPMACAPALPDEWLEAPGPLRLVVLDGTWRKSRKMLYANPPLQHLPRLALEHLPPSRYVIRKAHRPQQRSSFEATVLALAAVEGWEDAHPALQTLWQVFDAAMRRHQALRPALQH